MSNLKPCPFCGGEATIEYDNGFDIPSYALDCVSDCPFSSAYLLYNSKEDAIKAWNTRAGDSDE